MKLICFSFLALLSLVVSPLTDPIDRVAKFIEKGNTHELAKLFSPNVDITVLSDENTYTSTQAELILERFFVQNKPLNIKILHKINSSTSYRFGVVILTTDKGVYRVAFTLKGVEDAMQLIELRIEDEKVK
jgi:hypothetical protein